MQTGYPRVLIVALVWSIFSGGGFLAKAYIGETAEALRGPDGKYDAPIAETERRLKESQERVDVFLRKKIRVAAEYDSTGKVWRVTYEKSNFADKVIDALLERNSGGAKWSKPLTFRGNRHWISDDKKLHAVYYPTPRPMLIVMTAEAAKAERVPQGLTTPETRDVDGGSEEKEDDREKSEVKEDDPLDGF